MNILEMAMAAKMAGGEPLPYGETVKESDTVYWDGTVDGYVTDSFWGIPIVKVSDVRIPNNELFVDGALREIKITCVLPNGSTIDGYISSAEHQFGDYDYYISATAYDGSQENVAIGFIYTAEHSREKDIGIWFIHMPEQGYTKSLAIPGVTLGTITEIKTIDPKFIPGIKINKIVFTDRPSLWAWMVENARKINSAEIFSNGVPCGTFKVTPFSDEETATLISASFSSIYTDIYENGEMTVDFSTVSVTGSGSTLNFLKTYNLGETITKVGDTGVMPLPDEYWTATGTEVTIYYYSE